jgi:hypothetical protein
LIIPALCSSALAVFIFPGGVPILFDHESVTHFKAELRKKTPMTACASAIGIRVLPEVKWA